MKTGEKDGLNPGYSCRISPWLNSSKFLLTVALMAAMAPSVHSSTLFSETFDGIAAGTNYAGSGTTTFQATNGNLAIANTNASTLFSAANSASVVAGGDAGSNYAIYGSATGTGGAGHRLRSNTITGLATAGLFSVVLDLNNQFTGTADGSASFSLVNTSAGDINGTATTTLTGFVLAGSGAVTAFGGVTLTGGTATVPIGSQFILSLVVNDANSTATFTAGGSPVTLAAFTSNLYSYSVASGALSLVGTLTSNSAVVPQQLGIANFSTSPDTNLDINEINVQTGAVVGTAVPEPSAWVLLTAAGLVMAMLRRRFSFAC